MDLNLWIPLPQLDVGARPLPLGSDDRAVLDRVDGTRSVQDLVLATGLDLERVLAALVKLHDLAALQAAPIEVTAALASYRDHDGSSVPAPIMLDPSLDDHGTEIPPLIPRSSSITLTGGQVSAFLSVPTETETLTTADFVAPDKTQNDPDSPELHQFVDSQLTDLEPEGEPAFASDADHDPEPESAEPTVVDARVLPDEPDPDEWGDEPGTIQDGESHD